MPTAMTAPAARVPHLQAGEPLAIAFAPLAVTLLPASASAAAILRLAAAHGGLTVEVAAIATADPATGQPMTLALTARLADGAHMARRTEADPRDTPAAQVAAVVRGVDDGLVMRAMASAAREAMTPDVTAADLIIHPADRTGDAWHKPDADDTPAASPSKANLDSARLVLDRLAINPVLADAVRHLLRPLVEHPLAIDGNVDAVLTRAANDIATVRASQLRAMARRFTEGRHRKFPERAELMAALGEVVANAQPQEDNRS